MENKEKSTTKITDDIANPTLVDNGFSNKITYMDCSEDEDPNNPNITVKNLFVTCRMTFSCGKYAAELHYDFTLTEKGNIILLEKNIENDREIANTCNYGRSCGMSKKITFPCIEKIEIIRDRFIELLAQGKSEYEIEDLLEQEFMKKDQK